MSVVLSIENLFVSGVDQRTGLKPIVQDVSLTVERGEVLGLIGESGSGKSTIALATLAYARPGCRITAGRIRFDGDDLLTLPGKQLARYRAKHLAYVPQNAMGAFNPALTLGYQLVEASRIHRLLAKKSAKSRMVDLCRDLALPQAEGMGRRFPHQVSGGQLQRMAAAMALLNEPQLIIFDEPTTALDVVTQINVLNAFKTVMAKRGSAAIFVTHDLAVMSQVADRIAVLDGGRVVELGTVDAMLSQPQHPSTQSLLRAAGYGAVRRENNVTVLPSRDALITMRGVTASYGGDHDNPVLQDVDLSIAQGETVGVIGESGCGKSTLARVLAGLLPPSAGGLTLDGEPLAGQARLRRREQLAKVQIVFQSADTALNTRQRVGEILARPLKLFQNVHGSAAQSRVTELLSLVELPADFARRYPNELSGGQKQRVNLARALAANPALILCDEVTSSLDTVLRGAVIDLLKRLNRDLGVSYLFISHDISTVADFADRIVVLYRGRVVEHGPSADVLSPPFHPYTRLLLSSLPELRTDWLDELVHNGRGGAGHVPETERPVSGCPFAPRCPVAIPDVCDRQPPPTRMLGRQHAVACHRAAADLVDVADAAGLSRQAAQTPIPSAGRP